jgi:hypothetical protein
METALFPAFINLVIFFGRGMDDATICMEDNPIRYLLLEAATFENNDLAWPIRFH